jgi:hypothetical protein
VRHARDANELLEVAGNELRTAQVIERAAQVDVRNVDMPVLMRSQRLLETGSLARWLALPPR